MSADDAHERFSDPQLVQFRAAFDAHVERFNVHLERFNAHLREDTHHDLVGITHIRALEKQVADLVSAVNTLSTEVAGLKTLKEQATVGARVIRWLTGIVVGAITLWVLIVDHFSQGK